MRREEGEKKRNGSGKAIAFCVGDVPALLKAT